jgi:hypothetical protein
MFAAAACSAACFSSLPPFQQKLNQASTKCLFEHVREKELRTSKKIEQLPRGKEKRARNQERKKKRGELGEEEKEYCQTFPKPN